MNISKVTEILPQGTKRKIAERTGETYTTVCNVWAGKQFKKNIVNEIVRIYKLTLKKHTTQ